MRKWLDSPRALFAALRVIAVAAILAGVWLSVNCGVLQALEGPADAAAVVYVVTAMVNCALWVVAWSSFFGLCSRMIRGGSGFTQENSRSLKVIGGCVAAISLVMCGRALPRMIASPDVYLVIEAVVLPGTFLTIGALAFVLSGLLDHAMALEAEQEEWV